MAVRIVVADDHGLVRRELRLLLEAEDGWLVCGEAEDGREAVRLCKTLRPDVIALDISMPLMGGLEAAHQIRRITPAVAVVIVSMHDGEAMVMAAVAAGARAYISKSEAPEHLVPAIRALLQSNATYFSPRCRMP